MLRTAGRHVTLPIAAMGRIAVVGGGGAAGLAALRVFLSRPQFHGSSPSWEIVAFESREAIGGIWLKHEENRPTLPSRPEEHGSVPVTPLYDSLTTNLPHPIMTFHNFLFAPGTPLYPTASHVCSYLSDFADHFGLRKHIRFNSRVEHLEFNEDTAQWSLRVIDDPTAQVFDSVIIANGHYSSPRLPNIPDIDTWAAPGTGRKLTHSMWYREPSPFKNLNVLVVGAGPSGMDMSNDIAKVARVLYRSIPGSPPSDDGPIKIRGRLTSLRASDGSILFEDGTSLTGIDHILFATGYNLSFPFFPPLTIPTSTPPTPFPPGSHLFNSSSHVFPLSRHIFPLRSYPPISLAFIGLPKTIIPFPAWEDQAQAAASIILNTTSFNQSHEESLATSHFTNLLRHTNGSVAKVGYWWHKMWEDEQGLPEQFSYREELVEMAEIAQGGQDDNWAVQSWARDIYAKKNVLRAAWIALPDTTKTEWSQGVGRGKNPEQEWVDLMYRVLDTVK